MCLSIKSNFFVVAQNLNPQIQQVFCGLYFSHTSNLKFIEQTLEFIDKHYLYT